MFAKEDQDMCCHFIQNAALYDAHHEKICLRRFATRLDSNQPDKLQMLGRIHEILGCPRYTWTLEIVIPFIKCIMYLSVSFWKEMLLRL